MMPYFRKDMRMEAYASFFMLVLAADQPGLVRKDPTMSS